MVKRILCAVVLLTSTLALAQTASISGVVSDSSGAVISGAEIVVTSADTGAVRTANSEASGTYSVPNLAVGKYSVEVKKQGFASFRVSDIVLTVDQAFTINATLTAGGSTEVVDVNAGDLPPVDLESSQISNLVEQQQMVSLPLITRDPYSLILLSPGTSTAQNGMGGVSVNGGRSRNNNFLLDGVDNNDTSVPGGLGGVLSANPDSTQEFRVITDTFNAEFGRNTGAIVDVVTKSGTNSLHGDAYYFGRWNGFGGARDYFNPGVGPDAGPMNPYIRHQFGFSVGGPIIKNRTFFFFNDEMDRFITTLTDSAIVPTVQFLTGKFNYTYTPCPPNSACQPAVTVPIDLTPTGANNAYGIPFDPTMAKVFALYPTISASQSTNGISGPIFFPSQSRTSTYNPVLKIDHKIDEKNALSMRYGYNHFFDPNPSTDDILPGFGHYSEKGISYGLSAQLTSTISNTLINNFQFGLNHIYANFYLPQSTVNILDGPGGEDSFGNGWDYTLDPFTSFASVLGGSDGQARTTGTVSYTDAVTWVKGSHTWKFGFDFRDIGERGFDDFDSRRQLTMNPLLEFNYDPGIVANEPANDPSTTLIDAADALYGLVIEDVQAQFFNKSGVRQPSDNKIYRQHEFDWFGQDSWKIRSNLTINAGLRYQLNGVPYEVNGNASNLFQDPGSYATGQPVIFTLVGTGTGHSLYQPDYKDIEPRIGFTWDPWRNGKTAIRGGFGIFHDRVFGNEFGNARANPPFQAEYSTFPIETINNAFGSGAFPSQPPTQVPTATIPDGNLTPDLVIFDQHFRNPASNSWNLDFQRQISNNDVLDLAYVGAMGVHVLGQRDGNPPDPTLVAELVAFCNGTNTFTNQFGQTLTCTQNQVSSTSLYAAVGNPNSALGDLPFNAVNNNALLQPFYQITELNSIYHGLQSKFTHRMSHGAQFQASYTWSHALDNGVDPLAPNLGARTFPRNSRNLRQSYGNSDNDVRHIFVANYIWNLPFGRGQSHLSDGFAGRVLEGMQLSGIFSAQTGTPFNVRGNEDTQRTGINAWGYQVGDPFATGTNCAQSGGYVYMPNAQCAFTNPPWGSPSNNARNMWFGPGFWDWDMNFSKIMSVTERVKAEFRFEGYNVFNHTHFNNVGADGLGNLLGSGEFGVITSTATQPDGTTSARQVQVALRISF
jgi:Carboxypeptidase regulatory-like domain